MSNVKHPVNVTAFNYEIMINNFYRDNYYSAALRLELEIIRRRISWRLSTNDTIIDFNLAAVEAETANRLSAQLNILYILLETTLTDNANPIDKHLKYQE